MAGMSTVRIVNEAIRLLENYQQLIVVEQVWQDVDSNLVEMRLLAKKLHNDLPKINDS